MAIQRDLYLHLIGTASGTPSKQRNVSATALSFEGIKPWYLVDCGEGTQHRLLHSPLSLYHLEAIFITHLHGDHCYGLPGLLASTAMQGRTAPLTLVAPQSVINFVHGAIVHTELGLDYELHYRALEEIDGALEFERVAVELIALQHRVPSVGFKFTERKVPLKLKLDKLLADGIESGPHFNRLQRGENATYRGKELASADYTFASWEARRVIICGDNERPSLLLPYVEDVSLVCHEATFTCADLHRIGFHTGHSDAKRVAQFAEQANLPALVLTHFSARYHDESGVGLLEQEARAHFHGALFLAEDGMVIAMDTGGNSSIRE